MKKLELDLKTAQKLYLTAATEFKEMLEINFGKDKLSMNIMDKVKTVDDAIEILGEEHELVRELRMKAKNKFSKSEIASSKLKIIACALNEGTILDYFDENQVKYYIWTKVENGKLVFYDWTYNYSCAGVPSLLCVKSSELATYLGKQFINEFNDYLL